MKTYFFFVAIFLVALFQSCKKGEVPDNKSKYIGIWKNTSDTTESYRIIINADGTGEYHEISGSGYKDILGYVYFDGYDFKIGARKLNKKIKTNMVPQRVTITTVPYKYYTIATFNGVNFKTVDN